MRSPLAQSEVQADDLDRLVQSITAAESIVAGWDPPQVLAVQALKSAIEDLHKEALTRLILSLIHI